MLTRTNVRVYNDVTDKKKETTVFGDTIISIL